MSYPPPVHTGETADISATYRRNDTAPDITASSGNTFEYLSTGAASHGLFGLYRLTMQPHSGGPAPHFHRTLTESFYVLGGTVRIFDGREWMDCHKGDWVHVPEGGSHAFGNESGEVSRMLLHFSPGAPREPYFENLHLVPDMSEDERSAFFREHDTFWL